MSNENVEVDNSKTNFNIDLNLDFDILDWVDNSLQSWESYSNENTDYSSDNYEVTYNNENKSQIISTGNTNYNEKTTNIKADKTTQSLENDQDIYTYVNQGQIGDSSTNQESTNINQNFDSTMTGDDNCYTTDYSNVTSPFTTKPLSLVILYWQWCGS